MPLWWWGVLNGKESEYSELVAKFVELNSRNQLLLNVGKTKEMVANFAYYHDECGSCGALEVLGCSLEQL